MISSNEIMSLAINGVCTKRKVLEEIEQGKKNLRGRLRKDKSFIDFQGNPKCKQFHIFFVNLNDKKGVKKLLNVKEKKFLLYPPKKKI